jgi:site-specific DNA-methyltransferase (adenine-specific)
MKISLYLANCFEFLKTVKDNSVDLFLIDPPYDISRETNFQSGELTGTDTDRFRISMDFGEWDKGFEGMDIVMKEAYRVIRKGGTIISFYDLWKITTLKAQMEDAGFKQIRFIEWLKTNPVPINSSINYLTNAREIALLGVKGTNPTFKSKYDNGVYNFGICNDQGRFHPTQKPLDLMQALIQKHSKEGDLVLDCFAGSATTAVAAAFQKRDFIGCELDENYYNQAVERIKGLEIEILELTTGIIPEKTQDKP